MVIEERIIAATPIMPSAAVEALAKLCPDLASWPQRWGYEDSDIAPGERIVGCFTPFLLYLLGKSLATRTQIRN
jgi:hypothetical protein